jgi:enoyl-CoA hydratase/carnithine racemase
METPTLVHYDVAEGVAALSLDNPPANALSLATLTALGEAFDRALADAAAKVIVLTGKGRWFCAGANLRELHALEGRPAADDLSARGQALAERFETSPKPVIAAINGRYCLGGGTEIALACHLRICEEATELGSPEVLLGLMVGWGGSQRLPRLVGAGRALELLLTGRRVPAAEALQIGLVNRVAPDGAALGQSLALARELAALSAPVLAATLRATLTGLREGYASGIAAERDAFGRLCDNADWREGTLAFIEKRPPKFTDG